MRAARGRINRAVEMFYRWLAVGAVGRGGAHGGSPTAAAKIPFLLYFSAKRWQGERDAAAAEAAARSCSSAAVSPRGPGGASLGPIDAAEGNFKVGNIWLEATAD